MNLLTRLGCVALAVGLLGLGVGALVAPEWSSQTYGAPTDAVTWVRAAGVRDIVLGLATLVLMPHPAALRVFLPVATLLPLGDVVLVLASDAPITATAPHASGVVAMAVLAVLVWRSTGE